MEDLLHDERPAHRFLIVTVGSRGDIQPYIALANRLIANGHEVGIATHSVYESFVFQHGHEEITFCPLEGNPGEILNDPEFVRAFFEGNSGDQLEIMKKKSAEYTANNMVKVHSYVRDFKPTALIPGILDVGECLALGQRYCLPVVAASTVPIYASKETVPVGVSLDPFSIGAFNKALHWMAQKMQWSLFLGKYVNDFRASLKLPEINSQDWDGIPILHLYSSLIFPIPRDWPPHCLVTGYWILPPPDNYEPPSHLADFLEVCNSSSGPPVYFGFGSMPIQDKGKMMRVISESLAAVDRKGVFCAGWAEGEVEIPENVFLVKECPHEWLMPRCSVAIHHGGAGTTAASTRAGSPTIILHVLMDQPFWAQRIVSLGVGQTALCALKDLTTDFLVPQLRHCLTEEVRSKAQKLSSRLLREDGTAEAVSYIVGYCNQKRNPGGLELNYLPDSSTATCLGCNVEFTFFNRRHHCMSCGRVLCGKCVRYKDLPNYGTFRYCCEPCARKRGIEWP